MTRQDRLLILLGRGGSIAHAAVVHDTDVRAHEATHASWTPATQPPVMTRARPPTVRALRPLPLVGAERGNGAQTAAGLFSSVYTDLTPHTSHARSSANAVLAHPETAAKTVVTQHPVRALFTAVPALRALSRVLAHAPIRTLDAVDAARGVLTRSQRTGLTLGARPAVVTHSHSATYLARRSQLPVTAHSGAHWARVTAASVFANDVADTAMATCHVVPAQALKALVAVRTVLAAAATPDAATAVVLSAIVLTPHRVPVDVVAAATRHAPRRLFSMRTESAEFSIPRPVRPTSSPGLRECAPRRATERPNWEACFTTGTESQTELKGTKTLLSSAQGHW